MATLTAFVDMLQPLRARELPADKTAEPAMPAADTPQVAALLNQARADAALLLTAAQAEADELREDARLQAEALREAAWQEGFHSGAETARDVVATELRAENDLERAALRAELQAIVDEIGQARQALWERQEREMLAFVLEIARKIIKTEVSQNSKIVEQLIKDGLRRITDKENVRVRVSPGDAGRTRANREELMSVVDGLRNLEIVDDRRIGEGGCVIETQAGTVDAKIETQMDEIERALQSAVEG